MLHQSCLQDVKMRHKTHRSQKTCHMATSFQCRAVARKSRLAIPPLSACAGCGLTLIKDALFSQK